MPMHYKIYSSNKLHANHISERLTALNTSVSINKVNFLEDNIYDSILKKAIDIAIIPENELPYPLDEELVIAAVLNQDSENFTLIIRKNETNLFNALEALDLRKNWGHVYLAGFGPGDSELLTIKASKALQKADVIVYDDLIDKSFLEKYQAVKIYVGKRKGSHYSQQQEINNTLYENAIKGLNVVRIKGGDPLIFGRGTEEFHFLKRRFVSSTIIPGITSSFAAAASSIVPLTARGLSSSVALLSGHDLAKIQIPKAETLVFYMGASTQQELAKKLINEGWIPLTPVCVIRNASLPDEEIRRYTLESLIEEKNPMLSPLIIIVGNTASTSNVLLPKRWLYTGLDTSSFKQEGIFIHSPLIDIKPLEWDDKMIAFLNKLDVYDRIIFSSKYAVNYFFDKLFEHGLDSRALSGIEITPIGTITKKALKQKGILCNPLSDAETTDGLISWFRANSKNTERILYPRSESSKEHLSTTLTELGNYVDILPIFNVIMPDAIIKHNLEEFHGVEFTSPAAVDNFYRIYEELPSHLKVITGSKATSDNLKNRGVKQLQLIDS